MGWGYDNEGDRDDDEASWASQDTFLLHFDAKNQTGQVQPDPWKMEIVSGLSSIVEDQGKWS